MTPHRRSYPVCILNAGGGGGYFPGLIGGLAGQADLDIDVIDLDSLAPCVAPFRNVTLRSLGPDRRTVRSYPGKARALLLAYLRALYFIASTRARVLHVQWPVRFEAVDRVIIATWCKLWRKSMVLTVHNTDIKARDTGKSGWMHKATLGYLYGSAKILIAHTGSIATELMDGFGVPREKIVAVPHGINDFVAATDLSAGDARKSLGIPHDAKVILLFGAMSPYKGIPDLLQAFRTLRNTDPRYHLILAGKPASSEIETEIRTTIARENWGTCTTLRLTFVPDAEIEPLFAAADCAVLPYRRIFQSGVPFLAFRFGVPVVATNAGGLSEVVLPGFNGMLAEPGDPDALASAIRDCFESGLHSGNTEARARIRDWAMDTYSWARIGDRTAQIYRALIAQRADAVTNAAEPVCDR